MSKPKEMLDAVKTARSIHNGDYSSLRGKSFLVCDNIENNQGRNRHVNKHKSKYTLNQLGLKVDQLGTTVDSLSTTVNNLTITVNDLAKTVSDLAKQMNARFDSLEKDVNTLKRDVKDINARLDYNNLKKLPIER